MPLNYATRALLQLQESGQAAPLAAEPTNTQLMTKEERLAALGAVMTSDAVLYRVADDLGIANQRARLSKVQELRQTLRLEGAGSNFIEIFHNGSKPDGLGNELRLVILEILQELVPAQNGPDAIQMLIDKYRSDLVALSSLKTELEGKLAALVAKGGAPGTDPNQPGQSARGRVHEAAAATMRLFTDAGFPAVSTPDEVQALLDEVAPRNGPGATTAGDEGQTRDQNKLIAIRTALAEWRSAIKDEQGATATVQAQADGQAEILRLREGIATAHDKIATKQKQLKSAQSRLETSRLVPTEGVLQAPELIRIVDMPRDPEAPTRSRLVYLLAAIAAGVLLGFTLAGIAEVLDDTLRAPKDFSELLGAPVVARIGTTR